MTLNEAVEGVEYIITSIETDDDELDDFLFSLAKRKGRIKKYRFLSNAVWLLKDFPLNLNRVYSF